MITRKKRGISSFLRHNCLVNFSSYSDYTLSVDKGTQILEFPFLIRPCKDFWDSVIYEVPAFCNSSGKRDPLLAYWFALLSRILLASLCKRAVTGTSFLQLESVFESMASSSFSTSQTISTCRRSTSLFVTGWLRLKPFRLLQELWPVAPSPFKVSFMYSSRHIISNVRFTRDVFIGLGQNCFKLLPLGTTQMA